MDKKEKILKLKNRYSSEVVLTTEGEYDNVRKEGNYNFISVFHADNPNRRFLVNRDSYEMLTK